jgi:ATP-dependent DNA ligase
MEGIVAKKKGSPYVPGPRKSTYWLKTKIERTLQAYVGGISLKNGHPASLLLGLEQEGDGATVEKKAEGKLHYIGSVSSGLGWRDLAAWYEWGLQNGSSHPPFSNPPRSPGRKIMWIKPLHQVQVVFNEWTPGLKLRAPRVSGSFLLFNEHKL